MAFTYQQTNFVNRKIYNEKTHAEALHGGIPNFANFGLEYADNKVSAGRGINGGAPFVIGKTGETQDITEGFTGFLVVRTTFSDGVTSITELVEMASVPENTDIVKYFGIYELDGGIIVSDLRHVEYVKSVEIVSVSDEEFAISINGTISNVFSTSALQEGYTKSDADGKFKGGYDVNLIYSVADDTLNEGSTLADILAGNIIANALPNHPFVFSYRPETSLPNLQLALDNFMEETYGVTSTPGRWGFEWHVKDDSLSTEGRLIISANSFGETWYCRTDNFGNLTTSPIPNANLIRPEKAIFGETLVQNLDSQPTDKTKSIPLYYNPEGHKLGDGFTITLGLSDYAVTDLAWIFYVFSPLDADGVPTMVGIETKGYKNYPSSSEFLEDGFYNQRNLKVPGRLDSEPLKKFDLSIDGVVTGKTTGDDNLNNAGCISIFGLVSDEAFYKYQLLSKKYKEAKKKRISPLDKYPTIATKDIKDEKEIYLKSFDTAYDIYGMGTMEKVQFLKDFKESRGDE